MLTPDDRQRAIDILVNHYQNCLYSHNNMDTKKLLLCGFKGFAAFSDEEVVRALHKIKDTQWDAAQILRDLADFELIK